MDKTLHISFIIPIYNVPEPMLRECIESITRLDLKPEMREIIVVDDGSAESPSAMLATFGSEIIYIRTANGGVSAARNTGLRMARGEYIQFVDGDDQLQKKSYEHVLQLVERRRCDMVMFDFTHQYDSNTAFIDNPLISGSELLRNHNIHGSVCGYLFRRQLLGTLQFTTGVAYGEDEEFSVLLLLRSETVCTTTAQAYYYRERPTSAIHATDESRINQRLNDHHGVLLRLNALLDTLPTEERIALERRIAQLTMDYIYNIIRLKRDSQYLNQQIETLHSEGLFPLPDHDYTAKYRWFRRISSTSIGRQLLLHLLPHIKKER